MKLAFGWASTRMNYPDFNAARSQFIAFLVQRGKSGEPLWLTRDDVVVVGGTLFINPPTDGGERAARERYAAGVRRRLGVCLSAFAHVGSRLGCAVYVPNDQSDAEHSLMPNGLKLRVADAPFHAHCVRPFVFNVLRRLESRTGVWEDALHELERPNKAMQPDALNDARG